ncbi:MAG: glycosyltransferase family 39 protein [Lentisphaeria bacterium]|nr:glycosyltransferase family 39 protein [Lentisphaeria bacterium]
MITELVKKIKYPKWDTVAKEMNPLCRYAWHLTALLLLAYVPLLFISQWPGRDLAGRYAPMAEAFAAGDFQYAFHPRCQILHTSVAGITAFLTSCSGYLACKLTSYLFYIFSFFPLYGMAKKLFSVPVARGTILLFACCAPVVNLLAVAGERDSAKMFVQLLMAYSLVSLFTEREKLRYYILLGIAGGLAICTRSDLLLIVAAFLFLCGIFERYRYCFVWRTLTAVSMTVAVSSLELAANSYSANLIIPGSRFYGLIRALFQTEPSWSIWYFYICIPGAVLFLFFVYVTHFLMMKKAGRIFLAAAGILSAAGMIAGTVYLSFKPESNMKDYIPSVVEGFSPVLLPIAVLGILFRKLTKQWTKAELLLIVLFLIFDFSVLIQIAITDKRLFLSPRYIIPALPLLLPWCWTAVCAVSRLLAENFSFVKNKILLSSLLCLSLIFAVFLGYRKEINLHLRIKDAQHLAALKEIAGVLKKEKMPSMRIKQNLEYYCSPKRPFVLFDCSGRLAPAAYLGGGSTASAGSPIDMIVTDAAKGEKLLRKQFVLRGRLQKCSTPIPLGKRKLQIWKHTLP